MALKIRGLNQFLEVLIKEFYRIKTNGFQLLMLSETAMEMGLRKHRLIFIKVRTHSNFKKEERVIML
jgi:hypothetical protein